MFNGQNDRHTSAVPLPKLPRGFGAERGWKETGESRSIPVPPRIPVDDIYDDDDDNVLAAAAKDHGAMTVPTFTRVPDVQPERERRAKPVAVETAPDTADTGEDTDDFQTWLKKCLAERTRLASTSPAATPVPVPVELPRDRDTFHLLLRE